MSNGKLEVYAATHMSRYQRDFYCSRRDWDELQSGASAQGEMLSAEHCQVRWVWNSFGGSFKKWSSWAHQGIGKRIAV
jgi:hypothetical protein